jgi:hypothetical protein
MGHDGVNREALPRRTAQGAARVVVIALAAALAAEGIGIGIGGALSLGCGSPPNPTPDAGPPGCGIPFLGDPRREPELELIALDAQGKSAPVKDGDAVAMILPIQGGRVIFTGVRATNVDPCGVKIAGALRDLATRQARPDIRTVNLTPTGDGWGVSDPEDLSSFANVPVCPNQWSKTDLFGATYELSVTLIDRDKRTFTRAAKVRPACAELDNFAECTCICKGGYVLGEACDASDGGNPDGGSGDGGDGVDAGDGGSQEGS